jgi:hypothetical protein
MPAEPPVKRAVAFVDGQNLFQAARSAFGHNNPNYDIGALVNSICAGRGWQLNQVRRIDRATYDGCIDARDYPS